MKLETVTRELGLDSAAQVLEVEWESSQASLPQGELFFLVEDFITRACQVIGIPEEVAAAAVAAGGRITSRPAARALVWHFHYCMFRAPEYNRDTIDEWPSLDQALGGDGRAAYLLALLSGALELEQFNRAHAAPREVVRDTLREVARCLRGGGEEGTDPPWGLRPRTANWLLHHVRGDLYRLGRLQFQYGTFPYRIVAFRHRRSKAVLALSEDGVTYREDGGRPMEGVETGAGAWSARLVVGEKRITGAPISPDGRARREEVTLATADWERVLTRGMPAQNIHIPGGRPMAHDECGESIGRAIKLYARHFPDRPFDVFCCGSWLLDSELQELLPETSNIVRFQREFYLLPRRMPPSYLLKPIFGSEAPELASAPRDTALRRALLDRMSSGRSLRPSAGACFLLPEDFNWGGQVYLKKRPTLAGE